MNSFSYSSTGRSGDGGNISLTAAQGNIDGDNSRLNLNSSSVGEGNVGRGGSVRLEAQESIANLEIVTLSSSFLSGDVQVQSSTNLSISNVRILTGRQLQIRFPPSIALGNPPPINIPIGGVGQSGQVNIRSLGSLNLINSSIQSDTKGGSSGGDVFLYGSSNIIFRSSEIISNTISSGRAGNIYLTAPEVQLDGNSSLEARSTASGIAGNITVITDQITFHNGAQISSATSGRGQGGSVSLISPRRLIISGNGQISAQTSGEGSAGRITIDAPVLTIRNQGRYTTASTGNATGQGGDIVITALDSVTLRDVQLSAGTSTSGNGGDVTISTGQLNLYNSRIRSESVPTSSPVTAAPGRAGSIVINVDDVRLMDATDISVSAQDNANAGSLFITANTMMLSSQSRITAETDNGVGGNIQLQNMNVLSVHDGEISASTQHGTAGDIAIEASRLIQLTGNLANGNRAGVRVEATSGGTAGNLEITTPNLNIQDGAGLTVNSPQGQAGSLTITAENINLNNGQLTALTGRGSTSEGANINLQGLNLLIMGNSSLISAEALANANGGNVTIDAQDGYVIGLPLENNDIIATATQGNGGTVEITANRILGYINQLNSRFSTEELRTNDTNDISASSQFGAAGTIALSTLTTDPSQGLTDLPTETIDASGPSGQQCHSNSSTSQSRSEFYVSGHGGLPTTPTDALDTNLVLDDLGNNSSTSQGMTESGMNSGSAIASTPSDEIIEAQGWTTDTDGTVVLTANATTTTPHEGWRSPLNCTTAASSQ